MGRFFQKFIGKKIIIHEHQALQAIRKQLLIYKQKLCHGLMNHHLVKFSPVKIFQGYHLHSKLILSSCF